GTERDATERTGNQQFPAGDGLPSAPGEEVAEPAARHGSHAAEEVRNGGHNSHARDAHVAFVLQVIRQPAGVEPKRVDGAEEAGNHAPCGPVSEELSPFGKGWRLRGGVRVALGQVAMFFGSEANFRG